MRFIFDLDGTLIDSAPAIRRCLEMATTTVAPACLSRARTVPIGPPLARTVESILGEARSALSGELVREFVPYFTSVDPIVEHARELLDDKDRLAHLSRELVAITQPLAKKKASEEVARIVLQRLIEKRGA